MAKVTPELSLYGKVLRALDEIGAPYMVLGGFAARVYGSTRTTHDIDMVVSLEETHLQALAERFPLPRYYADPFQMRNAMAQRTMFNIIDSSAGDKVDLIPVNMNAYSRPALARRIRLPFEDLNGELIEAWFARPDDVIIGKLHAWNEGHSLRHEQDIGQMLLALYLDRDGLGRYYDEAYADRNVRTVSASAWSLWNKLKRAARDQAEKLNRAK